MNNKKGFEKAPSPFSGNLLHAFGLCEYKRSKDFLSVLKNNCRQNVQAFVYSTLHNKCCSVYTRIFEYECLKLSYKGGNSTENIQRLKRAEELAHTKYEGMLADLEEFMWEFKKTNDICFKRFYFID
jgi:hypothetical protein